MFLACCDWETAIDAERNYENFLENKFIEDSNFYS
jgi:hypothetical protein